MRDVCDPSHVLHDPVTEVQYGIAVPMYEVPVRVASPRCSPTTTSAEGVAEPSKGAAPAGQPSVASIAGPYEPDRGSRSATESPAQPGLPPGGR